MLIFIDDSGDPGFKTSRGSSPALVIALVCFRDNLEAEKTAVAIKDLRRRLGLSDNAEFRFSQTKNVFKVQFLSTVSSYDFKIRAVVFEKDVIYSPTLQNNKDKFYRFAIKTALDGSRHLLKDANIKIDGHGDRPFRHQFESYLRRELKGPEGNPLYSKLSFVKNSENNVLIQLADMCAGAINRSYSVKADKNLYLDIIRPKIENLWPFR